MRKQCARKERKQSGNNVPEKCADPPRCGKNVETMRRGDVETMRRRDVEKMCRRNARQWKLRFRSFDYHKLRRHIFSTSLRRIVSTSPRRSVSTFFPHLGRSAHFSGTLFPHCFRFVSVFFWRIVFALFSLLEMIQQLSRSALFCPFQK